MPIAPLPDNAQFLPGYTASSTPIQANAPVIRPPEPAIEAGLRDERERQPQEDERAPRLEQALETLNTRMEAWSTNLRFSVDKDTDRVVVTVLDTNTGDIIRQIPTEEALQVARSLGNLQGLALNTSA